MDQTGQSSNEAESMFTTKLEQLVQIYTSYKYMHTNCDRYVLSNSN